jgi:2',3'-cyclic-nucleotide 2'-phosphodiesterase (5'-nucleotidase family)
VRKINTIIVACILIWSCNSYKLLPKEEVVYQKITLSATSSNMIDTFLDKYKYSIDSIMKVKIGTTSVPLTKSQPESTMGNFVADAQLLYAKQKDPQVVASVINYGGLRIPYLAKGDITVGNIYEIMPFDNVLSIIEVPGKVVKEMCQLIIDKKGWPIAGIEIVADLNTKKVKTITINGTPINDQLIYKIAISDYLANGGDDCEFFLKCKRLNYNVFIRDMLIEYLVETKNINPILNNRIVYE